MLDPNLLRSYNAVRTTPNTDVFCHAPFASVNFAQNGDATVCCYNRTYVLGTYPTASLDEIWHGTRARELRQSMARNELPRGCDICLSQFWSSNFSGLRARSFDHLSERAYRESDERLLTYPKLMEFEISNVCNLECTMCNGFFSSSIRHNREHLPPLKSPYDDAFVHNLEPFIPHLQEARFLGGEPFLIRTYYQIWDLIARLNPRMRVNITTNATMVNDRVKGVLDKMTANIVVSIDSLSRDTYEQIRINARYDEVMQNVDYFRDYTRRKGTWFALAVCPMRQNWREMPDIVRYCNSHGIGVYFNTVTFPGDATFVYMNHADLDEIVAYLSSAQLDNRTEHQRSNNAHYRDLVRQVVGYRDRKAGFSGGRLTTLPGHEWTVSTGSGCEATLSRPSDREDGVRLNITAVSPQGTGGVQLASRRVSFKADHRYVVDFLARADAFTEVTVGAQRAPPAHGNLGMYVRFGLSRQWERFEVDFVPSASEENGQIVFDAAQRIADIEVAEVTIRAVPLRAPGVSEHDSPVQEARGVAAPSQNPPA